MARYTADAVSMLCYLVDALPEAADDCFTGAEAGEDQIEAPTTALAEVLYSVARDRDVRGVTHTGTSDEARAALVEAGIVSVAPIEEPALEQYVTLVDTYSIHGGLVVASHRARATDAIITSDSRMRDAGETTVWK